MKHLTFFFLLFFLTGCDVSPKTGPDGYKFGDKQYTQTNLTIDVIVYPTRKEFDKEVSRRKLTADGNPIEAFSVLYVGDRSRCTIHMVDPSVEYSPEFVGHEFLHCVYGQWHGSNKERG